jgi:hypothetical protein
VCSITALAFLGPDALAAKLLAAGVSYPSIGRHKLPTNYSHLDLGALQRFGFTTERDAYDLSPWRNNGLTITSLIASLQAAGDENSQAAIVRIIMNDEAKGGANDPPSLVPIYVRVTQVRKVYELAAGDQGYLSRPAWYFEATLDQPRFDPAIAQTVRCYLDGGQECWQLGVLQFVNGAI